MMRMAQLALATLLTTSALTLSAVDPCTSPSTSVQKNVCDLQSYLSRYDSALKTLVPLIQNGLDLQSQAEFQKSQDGWMNSITQKIQAAAQSSSIDAAQNELSKDYAAQIQALSQKYADTLKTEFFQALGNPKENKDKINNLFYFIAANDFKDPFPEPLEIVMGDNYFDLGNNKFFFMHTTSFGANQGTWVPYLVDTKIQSITQLKWEECDNNQIKPGTLDNSNSGICGFAKFDKNTQEIVNFCKSGCVGTTGLETSYKIDGDTLKVVGARSKDNCDGKPFNQGTKPVCVKK